MSFTLEEAEVELQSHMNDYYFEYVDKAENRFINQAQILLLYIGKFNNYTPVET